MNVLKKISIGRMKAKKKAPYFQELLLSMVPREMPGLGTTGVTKNLLFIYDPVALDKWDVATMDFAWWHEAMHVMLKFFERVNGKDVRVYNMAQDLFINQQGEEAGYKLPDFALHPQRGPFTKDPMPLNLTTDEYYEKLMVMKEEAEKEFKEMIDELVKEIGAGSCGSCAGNPIDGEPEGKEAEAAGGRSPEEIRQTIKATAMAIQDQVQKGRGNIPGGLKILADEMLQPPKIPWQTKLARVTRNAIAYRPGAVDYRYSKPSRRQAGIGWGPGKPILPALIAPVPQVAMCLDTSGSMGTKEIMDSLAEGAGILQAVGAKIQFIAIDTQVNESRSVSSPKELADCLTGGGGTDFRPAFEHIKTLHPRPEVVIFATDGCGPAPISPPGGMKVIWLLVGEHKQRPYVAKDADGWDSGGEVPYGEFVEVS